MRRFALRCAVATLVALGGLASGCGADVVCGTRACADDANGAEDPGATATTTTTNTDVGPQACNLSAGDGSLDLDGPCVDGACLGDTYTQFVDALGSTPDCAASLSGKVAHRCDWASLDVSVFFEENAPEGPPDLGPAGSIKLGPGWPGTTAEGLGIGVPLACFVEVLGPATDLGGNGTSIVALGYARAYGSLFVMDQDESVNKPDDVVYDGYVSSISLSTAALQ